MADKNSDFMTQLPNLRGLVDSKVETIIYRAFLNVYDYFNNIVSKQKSDFETKLKTQSVTIEAQSSLLNGFGTKLIGLSDPKNPLATLGSGTVTIFTVTNTTIFDVATPDTTPNLALKVQSKNKFLSGPVTGLDAIPTFRTIVAADITGLFLDATILDWLAQ